MTYLDYVTPFSGIGASHISIYVRICLQRYFTLLFSLSHIPGTSISRVNATDADSGLNGEIGYIIRRGSKDNFVINFDTGVVSVAPDADLTIEQFGTRYEMTVSLKSFVSFTIYFRPTEVTCPKQCHI